MTKVSIRILAVLVTVLFLCQTSFPLENQQKVVEKSLRASMMGTFLILKTPSSSELLRFDAQGKSLSAGELAPVTLKGILQVEGVKLSPKQLQISARRIALVQVPKQPSLLPVVTSEMVRVVLECTSPINSENDALHLFAKVFREADTYEKIRTEYWKKLVTTEQEEQEARAAGRPIGVLEGERPVYRVKPGAVDGPIRISTGSLDDGAWRLSFVNGWVSDATSKWSLVVNEKGMPEMIEFTEPAISRGLDWNAFKTLMRMRFKPALRNGQPVATKIGVEFNFGQR
jgi:hypothetical protein